MANAPRTPALSVVVASIDAETSIEACLSALHIACGGLGAEILVADASRDRTLDRVHTEFPAIRALSLPPGTLAPVLWGQGLDATCGAVVAFLTDQCVVSPGWARALIGALGPGVGAAGGAFTGSPDMTARDWAIFFLRYSTFLEEAWTTGVVGQTAGNNTAYRRADLDALQPSFADGFWEVDIHRRLRERGLSLAAVTGATATLSPAGPRTGLIRQRFRHGRQFGAARVGGLTATRARVWLAAPVVPIVLAWRSARRVMRVPRYRRPFLASLPWLVLLAGAWACGEAVGAGMGAR